jgi:hypothetical protein
MKPSSNDHHAEYLVPLIDHFLNSNPNKPKYAFVIMVCEANDHTAGGETNLYTNMNALSAMHLVTEVTNQLKEKGNA